jgi:hypothetical protein
MNKNSFALFCKKNCMAPQLESEVGNLLLFKAVCADLLLGGKLAFGIFVRDFNLERGICQAPKFLGNMLRFWRVVKKISGTEPNRFGGEAGRAGTQIEVQRVRSSISARQRFEDGVKRRQRWRTEPPNLQVTEAGLEPWTTENMQACRGIERLYAAPAQQHGT